VTTTTYDLKGRRTNTSTFDPNGTLVRSIDTVTTPATTAHQYDALARMLKTVDALSGNTGYSYWIQVCIERRRTVFMSVKAWRAPGFIFPQTLRWERRS